MNQYEHNYPERLTLEWLNDHKLPVFVRNTTRPRGQLTINMPTEGGRMKAARIKRLHLPQELSAQFSMDTILKSDDLRQCIVKGVVELVRPNVAVNELKAEGAAEELESTQLSQYSSKHTFVSDRVKEMEDTQGRRPSPGAPSINELGVETHVLQPRVLSLIQKLENGDVSIKAAVSELKIMAEELQETDCAYIIANGPAGQVRTFAQKQLGKIRDDGIERHNVEAEPDMSNSEAAEEARREALARQHQKL